MCKKILYLLLVMISIGHYSNAQSPAISYFQSMDSCNINSTINVVPVYLQVSNPTTGLSVKIYWGDGTSQDYPTFGWSRYEHEYALPGTYTARAVLFDGSNNPLDSSQTIINGYCFHVKGAIYKRNDANCTYDIDTDEVLSTFQQIEVRKNNIPIDTFTANYYFNYPIPQADFTSEFSFHPLNLPGYQLACPASGYIYKCRLDTLNSSNNHFDYGYECSSGSPVDLFAYMSGVLRASNSSYLTISAGNTTCAPQNGTVTLDIDPQYTYFSASETPASVTGQTVTWNVTDLSGNAYKNIYVMLTPTDTLTPGDSSCHTVTITPTAGDLNIANNTFHFCDTIRSSYDPNEKKVAPMGAIAAGELLTYTINFENLGNDTAFNIYIVDTLSTNIDPASFEIIASSHRVNTNLFDYGDTRIVKFEFVNINLEDKDHPNGNKGFVMYQAKAKSNLVAGDEIKNTAHIFFDINPAVVTNTVSSKIPVPIGIQEIKGTDGLKIYPNPARNVVTVENQNNLFNHVKIINAVGQLVKEVRLKNGINKVDIANMDAGLYYFLISGDNGSRSAKFVKQ